MTRILLVGCGKMGGALLDGWRRDGVSAQDIFVVDPTPVAENPDVRFWPSADLLPGDLRPDVVVLAVKPQAMARILPDYRHFTDALFVSIAAGVPLATLAQGLGGAAALVRAMPNTPAMVCRGITVLVANRQVSDRQRTQCQGLFAAVGDVAWSDSEQLMDAVTALSGSGPAYVFLMVEAMAAAGQSLGLPPDLAQHLARSTVIGSGELLRQSPEPAARLRANVTSPNGTTAAALHILSPALEDLMRRAIAAASERSKELARAVGAAVQ